MMWTIAFHDVFAEEVSTFPIEVQDELFARAKLLGHFGPQLGRPHADTLKDSAYPNMKELRFDADGGVWRVTFAFDPDRTGILLVAGSKAGVNERRFYRGLIALADKRFEDHLKRRTKVR